MEQKKQREYLIERLLKEQPEYRTIRIPADEDSQRRLLRSLMNIRMPGKIDDDFQSIQDKYLQQINRDKGIVTLTDLKEIQPDLYIWKGDITRLQIGAIVNAANSGMTGCRHRGMRSQRDGQK